MHPSLAAILILFAFAPAASAQSLLYEDYGAGVDDQRGHSVAGGTDIDGDGHDDVVIGSPYANNSGLVNNGGIRVVSGRTGDALCVLGGDETGDHFGWSVAIAGDVNGDGWIDVIAGAPQADAAGNDEGTARVVSGRDWTTLHTFYGGASGDEFGFAVAGEFDFDDDGFADVAVGAPGYDYLGSSSAGKCYVFSGPTGAALTSLSTTSAQWQIGYALNGQGDLNGDGLEDLIIGEPGGTYLGSARGRVTVFYSGSGNTTWNTWGDALGDRYGASVASGLDLNGDGFDELLVGAPFSDSAGGSDNGSVILRDGRTMQELHTWYGDPLDDDHFGTSVDSCGDLDQDGVRDVLVGTPEEWGGTGRVQAFASLSHAELLELTGPLASQFGSSVADAGDFNDDGIPDAAVGAPRAVDPTAPLQGPAGLARVHSLAAPGFVNYCTSGTSASGCLARISGSGLPSATAPSGFVLSATDVEGHNPGVFFYGTNGRQANSWGNGTSFQCVVQPAHRAGMLDGSGTNGTCDGSFAQDLNALWCPTCPKAHHNPGPGALVQAQLWYRDPLSTSNQTTSLSDAIEFAVGP